MTFPGLWVVETFGRRRALIAGGLWQFMCFLVFASVGYYLLDPVNPESTPVPGKVMIAFACLFIAGYASKSSRTTFIPLCCNELTRDQVTWGPIVWAVIGEIFPTRYRSKAMGISR